MSDDIHLRQATDDDLPAIRQIFMEAYGPDYPYQDFYDLAWLRRALYNDDLLMAVAEEPHQGQVLGTGSVVFNVGVHSDLIGEFGRLAVHQDARGRGVGSALMAYRIEQSRQRLHLALVDNRTAHSHSQIISQRFDFRPVGFMPIKHRFHDGARESIATFARHFNPALDLRRNHPRIVADVATLAHLSMQSLQLTPDLIVDDSSSSYPADDDFQIYTLNAKRLPHLLRIEQGRIENRQVFGPIQLHHGFFKIRAQRAHYLVAHRPTTPRSAIQGALGFIHDDFERNIRIVELIAPSERSVRHLIKSLLTRARNMNVEYIEVDISAYAPQLQRTLLDLDFIACAYIPSMVFHRVERLDAIRFARPLAPVSTDELHYIDSMAPFVDHIVDALNARRLATDLAGPFREADLFRGLDDDQAHRLANVLRPVTFDAGELLFEAGDTAHALYLLTGGEVLVHLDDQGTQVSLTKGDIVGENAMLADQPHHFGATAKTDCRAAVLDRSSLSKLIHRRPDIGLLLYRNLAVGLGEKLRRTDRRLTRGDEPKALK